MQELHKAGIGVSESKGGNEKKQCHHRESQRDGQPRARTHIASGIGECQCGWDHPHESDKSKDTDGPVGQPGAIANQVEGKDGDQTGQKYEDGQMMVRAFFAEGHVDMQQSSLHFPTQRSTNEKTCDGTNFRSNNGIRGSK